MSQMVLFALYYSIMCFVFHIILSKNKQFLEAAELIMAECDKHSIEANILTLDGQRIHELRRNDVVFFLTNDHQVNRLTQELVNREVKILNNIYLLKGWTKLNVQLELKRVGIKTPKIISTANEHNDIAASLFPFFVKTDGHVGKVLRVANQEEFARAKTEFSKVGHWYAEEAVDGEGRELVKVYFVSGQSFTRDNEEPPGSKISNLMETISRIFGLDTFSADFFVENNDIFCFDVNPAPAHFGSSGARKALVDFLCLKTICKQIEIQKEHTMV